jgi:hypothetical protein
VAAAGERLAATHGVDLPDDLHLWALAGGRPATATPDGAPPSPYAPTTVEADLAGALEAATSASARRRRGLHVTPRWLADHLVGLVLDSEPRSRAAALTEPPVVCDPACGGGAFLLAVARALHARGVPRRQVVEDLVWGADIDAVGLAAAEAALAIWSGGAVPRPGHLALGDPLRAGVDLWPERPEVGFDLVVGNPPFQSQLGRATTRARADQLRLRARFGPAVRAYTDTAWLFLLLGCQLTRPGGRVVMVQPDSLAAARDAAAVRAAVDALADLDALWVDDRQVFAAAVRVCAPVLHRHAEASAAAEPVVEGRWHDLLAEATGVPALPITAAGRLGDHAVTLAGFRDEYYGLATLVREATPAERATAAPVGRPVPAAPPVAAGARGSGSGEVGGSADSPTPGGVGAAGLPLVTVGAIDWGRSAWGERPVRFAKHRWDAPVVDPDRLAAEGAAAARRWVARTAVPKVLVATQTRVVELAVDEGGTWVPSVPAIAVVPTEPGELWRLAAALASPAATVWLLRRAPGVALARGALKVAARDVAELPLPADPAAWDDAAVALRAVATAPGPLGGGGPTDALDAFTAAAAVAYGSPPEVVAWWRARLDAALAD